VGPRGDRAGASHHAAVAPPGSIGRPGQRRGGGHAPGPWQVVVALVALALVALVVAPYLDQDGRTTNARVTDITRDPDAFYNKVVAVRGAVDAIIDQRSITLGEDGGDHTTRPLGTLLVVNRGLLPSRAGDSLRVIGLVRRFRVTDVEREIGADLSDEDFAPWVDRPVIVATAVLPTTGAAALSPHPTSVPTGGTWAPASPAWNARKPASPAPECGGSARVRPDRDAPRGRQLPPCSGILTYRLRLKLGVHPPIAWDRTSSFERRALPCPWYGDVHAREGARCHRTGDKRVVGLVNTAETMGRWR